MAVHSGEDARGTSTGKWVAIAGVVVALLGVIPAYLTFFRDSDPPAVATTGSTPGAPPSGGPTAGAAGGYTLTSPATVPQCSDVVVAGPPLDGKEVALFLQHADDRKYYWDQRLVFKSQTGAWEAERVVIGDPGDSGKTFHLVLVPVTGDTAEELKKHDGAPYWLPSPPGEPLARLKVTRDGNLGNC